MAGTAVLASNAIGAFISACVGGSDQVKTVASQERESKRPRRSIQGGGAQGRKGAGPATQAQAHPPRDWWTGSSDEMDRDVTGGSGANRSAPTPPSAPMSGSSTPLQDGRGTPGNNGNGQFVNHALTMWNDRRRQWVGNRSRHRRPPREAVISPDATYEDILATSRPFRRPIPLPEMVDFLVDVWDQEGLYD